MVRTTSEILEGADDLARRFADHKPGSNKLAEGGALTEVRTAARLRLESERRVEKAVRQARVERHSWSAIGAMLGTTGEAARQRYRDNELVTAIRRLPIQKMKKAGWIDSESEAKRMLDEVAHLASSNGVLAAARRGNSNQDFTPEQLAWLIVAQRQAEKQTVVAQYDQTAARKLAESLAFLSASEEETIEVPQRLSEAGIRFVLLEQLPGSKIDGAAFCLEDGSPVVAMTIRYDRVDHFWYTLLHELAHIITGHVQPGRPMLDDESLQRDEDEAEADRLAASWILPGVSDALPTELAQILRLAQRLQIAPGLIIGRQHYLHEATGRGIPYSKHRSLLHPIRHLFAEAQASQ